MQQFTEQGWQKISDLARRHGVSTEAVLTLLQALVNGNGMMAQFHHPELGGSGQWLKGGMTMVGDMFNPTLKATVAGLCSELAVLLSQQPFLPPAGNKPSQGQAASPSLGDPGTWWPAELGVPNARGGQNQVRYAYFANARRLAVEVNGHMTVYDTLGHQIRGVAQQQPGEDTLTFTSQYGPVRVADLPILAVDGVVRNPAGQGPVPANPNRPAPAEAIDVCATLERLADLTRKGIIAQEEFAAKKAELLSRL